MDVVTTGALVDDDEVGLVDVTGALVEEEAGLVEVAGALEDEGGTYYIVREQNVSQSLINRLTI